MQLFSKVKQELQGDGAAESLLSQKVAELDKVIEILDALRIQNHGLRANRYVYSHTLEVLKEHGKEPALAFARRKHLLERPIVQRDILAILESGEPWFTEFKQIRELEAREEQEKAARQESINKLRKQAQRAREGELQKQAEERRALAAKLGVNLEKITAK